MAIARLIAPFSSVSGKITAPGSVGSTSAVVAMPDQFGRTLLRAYTRGVQPNTIQQVQARSILSSISEGMASLSQAQLEAWQALALEITLNARLGQTFKPTWAQIFQTVNSYRVQNAQSIILNPPTTEGAAVPTRIAAISSDDGAPDQVLSITVEGPTVTAGSFYRYRFTRNLGTGQRRARSNEFRYATTTPLGIIAAATGVVTLTATTLNIFSATNIGVEILVLNSGYVPVGRALTNNIAVTETV